MGCRNCHVDFCECYKRGVKERKKQKVNHNKHCLLKNNIKYSLTNNENVVVSYSWHKPVYIGLKSFKFRWEGETEWIAMSKKIRHLGFKLRESKYKGLLVSEAIEKDSEYMKEFIAESECIFLPECYSALGYDIKSVDSEKDSGKEKIDSKIFSFGKYKGENLSDVYKKDSSYIKWLYSQWSSKKDDF